MDNDQTLNAAQHERYRYLIENLKDILWEMDREYTFTYLSPNTQKVTGYSVNDLLGRKMPEFLTEDSRQYAYELAKKFLLNRYSGYTNPINLLEVQFICKDGTIKWFQISANPIFKENQFVGYIGTTRDITEKKEYESQLNKYNEELRLLNDKLEKLASTDTLTGAFNRRKFEHELNSMINKENPYQFSLIMFDIDHFKAINDDFGHKIGDQILNRISKLVLANIRETDRLFRWGGEEFIIILNEAHLENARRVAQKIWNIVQNHDFGLQRNITISLGVCEYRTEEKAEDIFSRVDKFLYEAKLQGRNRIVS